MSDMEEFIKKKHYFNDISTATTRKIHVNLKKYYDKKLNTRLAEEAARRKENAKKRLEKDNKLKQKEDDDFQTAVEASKKVV